MSVSIRLAAYAAAMAFGAEATAQAPASDAVRFGMRESIIDISMSPDGKQVAMITPGTGQVTHVIVANVDTGKSQRVMSADGKPERLGGCNWVNDQRLVCSVVMLQRSDGNLVTYTRLIAMNPDGSDAKMLSAPQSTRALGVAQFGGHVIDWLGDAQNSVLMAREFIPEATTGTRMASSGEGLGVERVDTLTLRRATVEPPQKYGAEYISDGKGTIRIMGSTTPTSDGLDSGRIRYSYRVAGSREWKPLGVLDYRAGTGFNPYAIDPALDVVYGFEDKDGRAALYRVALDGSGKKELVYERPDVDVAGLIRIGRQRRPVGVSFVTEKRQAVFFDPELKKLAGSLAKALPGLPLISFVDSSGDEQKLLFWAGSDTDPGRYYVFDRAARKLNEILLVRPELEHATLAKVTPVTFPAADGTPIPGYLTLPPGSTGKGLPAIVMPHGGPGARDEWGFDWLAQYFAARGFAVLQPNFRGSAGYGDAWFQQNGFKSWRTAIGDVNDGGRWLLAQGIAAPGKLGIVGWSYGGYAALQSPALDPELFKAIVAIAPVTDLNLLREESRGFTNHQIVKDFIGSGPHLTEGSPTRNVATIKAPVLLFHGDMDANVGVRESEVMAARLRDAGKPVEFVLFPGLDHQLDDAAARSQMLDKSDAFLRKALGVTAR